MTMMGAAIAPAPPAGSAEQRNHLDAHLTEYASLRQESLQSISNRIQIINFTFTSLAIILAALLASNIPRSLLLLVSIGYVPMAAKASALVWLGEYHRSQRAGQGIRALEGKVNDLLGGAREHLSWETSLYSDSTHMSYPYIATIFFVLSAGFVGEFLAGYHLYVAGQLPWVIAVLIYSLGIETAFLVFFHKQWIAIRRHSHVKSANHSGHT